jgi:cytochrome P450
MCTGHDTTASAISWAMYALAKYPDMQQRVLDDVTEVMGDRENIEWYISLYIILACHNSVLPSVLPSFLPDVTLFEKNGR